MGILQNVTKRSAGQGIGLLIFLIGAAGMDISKWGLFGFRITGIPLWCFALTTSVGGVLFFLSQMIFNATPSPYQGGQPPKEDIFLYLRPFIFDVSHVLQLGIGASTGLIVYATLLKGLWWPIALLPLVANISKEQSFKQVFEQMGQFIALGYPEGFFKPIIATVVHENESWEEEIKRYIHAARLVIIYPGEQKGIQWEIDQVMEAVPTERILFYLGFKGSRKKKERLYQVFKAQMSRHAVKLPAEIGDGEYLILDSHKRPHFVREFTFRETLSQCYSNSSPVFSSSYQPILASFGLHLPTDRNSQMLNLFFLFQPVLVAVVVILAVYSICIIVK